MTHFQKKAHGELQKYHNWFIKIYVDQLTQRQIATKGTSLHLLMTLVVRHGFIFWEKNLRPLLHLKDFRAHVEKETRNCIKIFRTDRGSEFTSHEFTNLCEMNGICGQLTAAYSPQQNGVAEMKNRTIMNMVRSMLTKKDIPKKFWPEAVNWSVHVLN